MRFLYTLVKTLVGRMATKSIVGDVGKMAPENVKHRTCSTPGCGTQAGHPDSLTYLFTDHTSGQLVETCRWCRKKEETEQRMVNVTKPMVYLALDLKIHDVEEPKEYQLSRDVRRHIKAKEFRFNTKIYVSDGERIWNLSDFRNNVRYSDMDWEMFNHLFPQNNWHLIETD
jgi:hypothetical protein